MFLQNPFPDAFGLNIGDLSIKLVQLSASAFYQKRYFKIKELRSVPLPPGLIINGEIKQPDLVREKLLYILGKSGIDFKPMHSSWIVANLPEPKTFLKLIDVESADGTLTSADVGLQAKKHLPFELEDTCLDWQIITSAAGVTTKQVLIAAVPKLITSSYISLFESAGLDLIYLEPEATAVVRSMITAEKDYTGQARAILDLGATRSNLIIYDNNSIQFSTTLSFSGEQVTTAIEQSLKIGYDEAEALKIKNGLKYDAANPNYLTTVSGMAEKLIAELNANFLFYKEHFNNTNPISHIILCGGMANWENMDIFISRQLNTECLPGHPWKNLNNKKIYNYDPNTSLHLACAIGLALKATQGSIQNNHHEK